VTDSLTALEASLLGSEEPEGVSHMHIGCVVILDAREKGGNPSLAEIRGQTERGLDRLPRLRQRLAYPRFDKLTRPAWRRDLDFDIENHVRRVTLPPPGGEDELLEWVSEFHSQRLVRARPLWEIVMLEGFADERWALALKIHHCVIDGIGGGALVATLLNLQNEQNGDQDELADSTLDPGKRGQQARRDDDRDTRGERNLVRPRRRRDSPARGAVVLAKMLLGGKRIVTHRTSLDAPVGAERHVEVVDTTLDCVNGIRSALGGTVNDVVLAAAATGLRRLFEYRNEKPMADSIRTLVPVNVRSSDDAQTVGVRVSSLYVNLPIGEPDPLIRYRRTVAFTEALKHSDQAARTAHLLTLVNYLPPIAQRFLERRFFPPSLHQLTVSNVPGPPIPQYSLGGRVRRGFLFIPVSSGRAVSVATFSYEGRLTFTIIADRAAVPDLSYIRKGIEESLAELARLAAIVAGEAMDLSVET
jgi:diacylglycerol O-acyltransferase / wax synthase